MNDRPCNKLIVVLFIIPFLSYLLGCSSNQELINEKVNEEVRTTTPADTNWQLTFSNHSILSSIALENLSGDTLYIVFHGMVKMLSVDSISELRFVRQSKFFERVLTGAKIGAVVGAVLAALIVNPSSFGNTNKTRTQIFGRFIAAVFFGLEGGILGGSIGAVADLIVAQDETLVLTQIPPAQKSNNIQTFLANHGSSRFRKRL